MELALVTCGETVQISRSYPGLDAHSVIFNGKVFRTKPVRGRYILIGLVNGITKIVAYANGTEEFNDIVADIQESGAHAELWIDRLTGEEIHQ